MIDSFTGKYRFLSNFYPCYITYDGEVYPSIEHAYQAAKTTDNQLRLFFMKPTITPGQAKKIGKTLKIREDWEAIKLNVMYELLKQKFSQIRFKQLLLDTKNEELIEGNNWGDTFWGIYKETGTNWLGVLLMKVREELQNTSKK